MTVETNKPWHSRKKPPMFCTCCKLFYKLVYPKRKWILIASILIVFAAAAMLVAALIGCFVGGCGGIVFLWPMGISVAVIGLLLFHCSWGSYLLDDKDDAVVVSDSKSADAKDAESATTPEQ